MAHDYSLGNRGATDPAPADVSSLAEEFFEHPEREPQRSSERSAYGDQRGTYSDQRGGHGEPRGAYGDQRSAYSDQRSGYSEPRSGYPERSSYAERSGYPERGSYAERSGYPERTSYSDPGNRYGEQRNGYSEQVAFAEGVPGTTLRPSFRASRSPWALPQEGDILLHKYRVEQVRGQSGLETVLFATHLELGQKVVLRVLSPQASEQPELVQRFARSARKAMEVRNEHVERVMDFGRLESGCPYRVAELPRGPSLAEILQVRGPLPVEEATDILLAVAQAVAGAYAARLSHCTLSAASVFVERKADGTPWARIVDFGAFEHFGPEHLGGQELSIPSAHGALPYTAPEQLRYPAAVDSRADIWALGALQYELLSGRPPFEAEGSIALLAMIAADTPMPLHSWVDVPLELERVVEVCLRKEPAARPQSISELAGLLSPFASAQGKEIAARLGRTTARSLRPSLPALSEASRSTPASSLGWQGVSVPPASVSPKASTWGGMVMAVGISIVAAGVTTLLILNDHPERAAAQARESLGEDGTASGGIPVGSVQLFGAAAASAPSAAEPPRVPARPPALAGSDQELSERSRARALAAAIQPAQTPLPNAPLRERTGSASTPPVQSPALAVAALPGPATQGSGVQGLVSRTPGAQAPATQTENLQLRAAAGSGALRASDETVQQTLAASGQSPASPGALFNDVE
jgi:eukaryotic-like serine/threonine-protein kinase